jgi:hypothetical protein
VEANDRRDRAHHVACRGELKSALGRAGQNEKDLDRELRVRCSYRQLRGLDHCGSDLNHCYFLKP